MSSNNEKIDYAFDVINDVVKQIEQLEKELQKTILECEELKNQNARLTQESSYYREHLQESEKRLHKAEECILHCAKAGIRTAHQYLLNNDIEGN